MKKDPLVVYRNEFNRVSLNGLDRVGLGILYSILTKVRNRGTDIVEVEAKELIELSGYSDDKENVSKFGKYLYEVTGQIFEMRHKVYNEATGSWFNNAVFSKVEYDGDRRVLVAQVDKEIAYIFNNLTEQFTSFELIEIVSLKSKYSVMIYKMLKQYKYIGTWRISLKDFIELCNVPEAYATKDINTYIINPAVKELSKLFDNLVIEKLRTGREITSYKFTFTPEKRPVTKPQVTKQRPKPKYSKSRHEDRTDLPREREYSDEELLEYILAHGGKGWG